MSRREKLAGYVVAVVGCAAVLECRLFFSDVSLEHAPLLPFLLAVTAAAWLGGRGPGVAATLLGAALGVFFVIRPFMSWRIEHLNDRVFVAVFGFVGVTVSHLLGKLHDARSALEAARAIKESDAHKDQYIATLAHELRNPLSAISGALQLWEARPYDRAKVDDLRPILSRNVRHLVRLTDELLDLARISSGKIILRRRVLDLENVIAEAVEAVRSLFADAGHDLLVTAGEGPIVVNGDRARLRQVFVNVLENAAKYTPPGGSISIHCENRDGSAVVRVRDNGAGIADGELSAIFDEFHQAEPTLGCSRGGLGIGLSLCRKLTDLHGGAIEARSEGLGKGSEFVITLPAAPCPPSDDVETPSVNYVRTPSALRILVVDDLHDCADTLANLLRSMGCDATPFYDGQAAVDWALAHRPDLVLTDIAMPGLDGYQVAARLRRQRVLDTTLLVAVTGFGQREDRRRAARAGFDFHVTKPVSVDQLQRVLAEVPNPRRLVTEPAVKCTVQKIEFTD